MGELEVLALVFLPSITLSIRIQYIVPLFFIALSLTHKAICGKF
jgi:hypothetical protein